MHVSQARMSDRPLRGHIAGKVGRESGQRVQLYRVVPMLQPLKRRTTFGAHAGLLLVHSRTGDAPHGRQGPEQKFDRHAD